MNIKRLKEYAINSLIYNTYYHKKLEDHLVYVESRDGNDFTGNILRIVEALSSGEYGEYEIVVYAHEDVLDKIERLKKNYYLKISKITSKESTATVWMEKAKYIITDSGLRPKFVKKPGQIVFNTWHGTPFKTMGRHNEAEEHRCGNIQQVFFACDYLLFPNDYMKEKMLNSYMMEKIYPGKILNEGYPRNSVFFTDSNDFKDKLGFKGKTVFAYMPTFKGLLLNRKDEKQNSDIFNYLLEIDEKLNDDQILLVKLHVYNHKKIDFSRFNHILPFPKDYETYDVLNLVDCLITDYSSVMFDYANTGRKIVLFNYDEEEYMKDRGTYMPLASLPFPKVQTVDDLIKELNSDKNYDDNDLIEKYCTYDNPNAIDNICRHVFSGEKICQVETVENNKKNVLIDLGENVDYQKIDKLINKLGNLDLNEKNYFISYCTWDEYIIDNHVEIFRKIPKKVEFCPIRSPKNPTLSEKVNINSNRLIEREWNRSFNRFEFDEKLEIQ